MLEIGKTYRVPRTPDPFTPIIDNMPNFNYETHVNGFPCFSPRRGINNFQAVTGPDNITRIPLILIDSTPKKNSVNYNPWHDELHPERGIIKFFGDNKPNIKSTDTNNHFLIEQYHYNQSPISSERLKYSAPIICFEKKANGHHVFQGFGVIESVEFVTQYSEQDLCYFSNYLFTICIFSLAEENEKLDWSWISDRCNSSLTCEEANKKAPQSWKRWIKEGLPKIHLVRRNVFANHVISMKEQRPISNSDVDHYLNEIYHYYDNRKHEFEALALEVTKKVIEENGGQCTPGWITKRSGDGGYDFVLRINVGVEKLSGLQIIVLGQAKCMDPKGHVSGIDIARTVARLKRGWVGAFVTTQPFSEDTQKEVLEDNYPLLLINGKKVAETVIKELRESEYSSLSDYLDSLSSTYQHLNHVPEDILD